MLGVSPLSPRLLEAFALSRLEVGLLLPAAYIGGLVFALPGGYLADRVGVRAAFVGGLLITGGPLVGAALAPSFPAFLGFLVVAGIGWSLVNPALARVILVLFAPRERGIAMGIKQMGLTLGGIASALVLPALAGAAGWRVAVGLCAAVVGLGALIAWAVLSGFAAPAGAPDGGSSGGASAWWWLGRPGLLVLFGAGLVLGMVQSAFLGYFPLFAVQGQGFTVVAAGGLLAAAQTGGALARLGLGAASDRWHARGRPPWLAATAAVSAMAFAVYAGWPTGSPVAATVLAVGAGVGALGWVGLYLVLVAEVGGAHRAGLLTGVGMAFIILGILIGAPAFGAILEASDSWAAAWGSLAVLSAVAALALSVAGSVIHRESGS
ncbi:MAG: MFS transporter [candidate division NC10 bacterium]